MKRNRIFNKLLSILLIISLLLSSSLPLVSAEENAEANTSVTSTPAPTEAPAQEPQPTQIPESPTPTLGPTAIPTPTKIPEPGDPNRTHSATSAFSVGVNPTPTSAPIPLSNNSIGDTSVDTGDAVSTANVLNNANNNLTGSNQSAGIADDQGASVINSGNGSNSDNNGSAVLANDSNTNQTNSANVNTSLEQSSTTGSNAASYNVGGNSNITTGDANTTGTVITAVNTNADGVMVSEFNIVDDHVGDILLDFNANCISGCFGEPLKTANTGNGSGSENNSTLDLTNTDNTFQTNDANIGSELNLSADTGNNTASYNTGGDSNITTGDANVAANVLTFANNNIAGDVVYAVVNVFGDLIGDILFPEDFMNNCCGGNTTASNTGNGSDSVNNADIENINTENTFQNNDANITNNLLFDATTGDNSTSKNTGGDSIIATGNTSVDANVLNIANTNLIGGNMWLVLVNEAGNWIGKILGAPTGTNYAGSAGTEFNIDENGFITASNNGNGSESMNNADINSVNNENTTQNNSADINNTLNLSANTGGNDANNNTGGNSNIKTGDATIVANLVNFVNNNIKGNGKLFVSVVNVFGSWFGDFVTPGQKKEVKSENSENSQNTGGPNTGSSTTSGSSNSNQSATSEIHGDGDSVLTVTASPKLKYISYSTPRSFANKNTDDKPLVKGVSSEKSSVLGESNGKNKIKINLAWVVLVLGFGLSAIFLKKLVLPSLIKKN